MMISSLRARVALTALSFVFLTAPAAAEKRYDVGASDTEIKVGNVYAYTGPAAAYGAIGKVEAAYFRMVNERGGVNGRKIVFISYDDAYSPPKTVEQTRKLVEHDDVLFLFNPLGAAPTLAVIGYLTERKIPLLFVSSGATVFGDAAKYPWTLSGQPNYQSESRIYAHYLLETHPQARIGVLFANDEFGRDSLKGLKDGLGARAAAMVVAERVYETGDTSVDAQILALRAAGADVLVNFSTPKFTALAIRKTAELGWKPLHIIPSVSQSVSATLKPAGLDHATGVLSAAFAKDPDDPTWADDEGVKTWRAFMARYMPDVDPRNSLYVYGYNLAQALVRVLEACGDDLTRANVMKQAESLKEAPLDLLLPGVTISTSPTDHFPFKQMQMQRFDGARWVRFGPVLTGPVTLP